MRKEGENGQDLLNFPSVMGKDSGVAPADAESKSKLKLFPWRRASPVWAGGCGSHSVLEAPGVNGYSVYM